MAAFLVPDWRGRSLCILTATDLAAARAYAATALPTANVTSIASITAPQAALYGQWCRMAPITA